ncbi:hypothetical protein E1A91_A08G078200v1 [Gossypium mustelinum]|uniref:Uncharacterized protein n=4 Tax=Gossypium TaxID=3633 RepID=A0A5J5UN54_GOSBA|nr:hypothetical protein ES319_A08G074600v1 [Gossypium barbadense]TYH05395.1 hypothetical protein ES288_A08G079700v1 [Gossypium darwinii]TYI13767.1 hypothetical protein ES332_A08G080600v1 [Gossypium tomentosum]TYJ21672.1 hypothetical protein E1A91_A08G078200v1 [Gossypium mustelinum]KAB2069098.1 hypothetical protein ES319_A08G074600v1 [Gossypium barbadense]
MALKIRSIRQWLEKHHYLFSPIDSYFLSLLLSPVSVQPNITLNLIFIAQYQRYSPQPFPANISPPPPLRNLAPYQEDKYSFPPLILQWPKDDPLGSPTSEYFLYHRK